MNKEHQEIIDLLAKYLTENPTQRFGQALFNLNINEFANKSEPAKANYRLRDIYGDTDNKIIERIKSQLDWFEEQRKKR